MIENVIVVRGGGDLASGVIHRLYRCGYRVLILECEKPSAIRRMVSFGEAVYDGESFVEGVLCEKIEDVRQCEEVWESGEIPLLVDESGACIRRIGECEAVCKEVVKSSDEAWIDGIAEGKISPAAVIDAIIAKRNLGTCRDMAPLTIGLGPGFTAGDDVDFVVETMRGHDLGRIIEDGCALPNTGVPGLVGGVSKERVIHSPAAGIICNHAKIGDLVEQGAIIAHVGETPVKASITGVLRGIIRYGYHVKEGMKIADIDPRASEKQNCCTISDKARCIAGSVVEILMANGIRP